MDDGSEDEFGPGEVSLLPPGHDAWVVGDEPVVVIDILRKNNFAPPDELFRSFFLCFIDPVRLSDAANRAPLQVIQGSI
jgi:hypothetical protein